MLVGTRSGRCDPARRSGAGAGRRDRRAAREGGSAAGLASELTEADGQRPETQGGAGDVATNRQASYRYNLLERFECGIVLTGTEVKSLREGNAQLKDAYARCATARCG